MADDLTQILAQAQANAVRSRAIADQVTPGQAKNLTEIAKAWPRISGTLALAFARFGLGPTHPAVVEAARGRAQTGEMVSAGTLNAGRMPDIGDVLQEAGVKEKYWRGITEDFQRAQAEDPTITPEQWVDKVKDHPDVRLIAQGKGLPGSGAVRGAVETAGDGARQVMTPVRGAARWGFAALEAPVQYAEGIFRQGVEAARTGDWGGFGQDLLNLSATDATTFNQMLRSRGAGTGSGFVTNPQSEVGQAQAEAARSQGLTAGHATTFGRFVGVQVFEPGSTPYNVLSGALDATKWIAGDPAAIALGKTAKAAKEAKVLSNSESITAHFDEAGNLKRGAAPEPAPAPIPDSFGGQIAENLARQYSPEDAGLVQGLRNTVLPERAFEWLNSPGGNRVADFAANAKDYNTIDQAFGKKLPSWLIVDMIDATSPAEVKQILAGALGSHVREAPKLALGSEAALGLKSPNVLDVAGMKVQRLKRDGPLRGLFQDRPASTISLHDPEGAVKELDAFMRNAKLPEDVISKHNEALARAFKAGDDGLVYNATASVMDTIRDTLLHAGVKESHATEVTRFWRDKVDELRHYSTTDIGENADIPGVLIGGDGKPVASPHLFGDYLNNNIPLPDYREIRRAVSKYKRIVDSTGGKFAVAAADLLTQDVFKPLMLLRGAWTVRVIGEEQVRMAATGYDSLFHHPLSYIAILAGERADSKLGRLAARMGKEGKLRTDATGHQFRTDASKHAAEELDYFREGMSKSGNQFIDPKSGLVTRHFVNYNKGEHGFTKAWVNELQRLHASSPLTRRMAEGVPVHELQDWWWSGSGQAVRKKLAQRFEAESQRQGVVRDNPHLNRAGSDAHVQSEYDVLMTKTNGHPQLLDAVANGRFMGHDLVTDLDINPKAAAALEGYLDVAPTTAVGPARAYGRTTPGSEVGTRAKQAVNTMFDVLMSKPDNYLSRSPIFRQAYWNRMTELADMLSPKSREAALAHARKVGAKDAVKRLEAAKGNGTLKLGDASQIAKKYALDETRDLLYDVSKRSQFFDVYRHIFPFGEAWKEVLTRWMKITAQNPKVPYRMGQLMSGARESGFFYTDPQTGEERFAYPGSAWVNKHLIGVPSPMTASVQGMNMVTDQMLPGFGPVVSIPVGMLLPDMPSTDAIRQLILPMGEGDTSGGVADRVFGALMPAYAKKFLTGAEWWSTPEQRRQLANTTKDVMVYLQSTGKYDTSTSDGMRKLETDAKERARWLFVVRGMAQFGAPSAPSPQAAALDKDGRLHSLFLMTDDLRKMQEEDYTTALPKWLEKYGEDAILAVIPKTTGTASATDVVYEFTRAHKKQADMFPNVFAYFAGEGGEFSQAAYRQQIKAGTRTAVTPQQAMEMGNQRVAQMIWNQAKEAAGDRTDDKAKSALKALKSALMEKYPGWPAPFDVNKMPRLIAELQRASKDPVLSKTDAGQALSVYLELRGMALEADSSFARAKSGQPIRAALRASALQLAKEHPAFTPLWEQVLERELADDVEEGT